jgi:hypothetical protein
MDIVFLGLGALFFVILVGLAHGCAALKRRPS